MYRFLVGLTTRFLKGITMFKNDPFTDPDGGPAYHRDKSCGSRIKSVDNKFGLKKTNSEDDKAEKRARIEKCHRFQRRRTETFGFLSGYIERQIYNHVYKNIFGYQDPTHEYELLQTTRVYQDLHRGEHISTDVKYADDTVTPAALTITHEDGIVETVTRYKKGVHKPESGVNVSEFVRCIKIATVGNQKMPVMIKTQTYDQEAAYMTI